MRDAAPRSPRGAGAQRPGASRGPRATVPAQRFAGARARMSLRQSSPGRLEPWRDWAVLLVWNHAVLVAATLAHPSLPWLLVFALPLGAGLAIATLTVLHDAGHRRLARSAWPNAFAVHTCDPVGLWVDHWTLKHRVHHKLTQVYPLDDATRASGMVRLHPSAARWGVHRYQHFYAWFLYGLAWAGELRSQVTFLRKGELAGEESPRLARRIGTFALEKAVCLLVLAPYFWFLGFAHVVVLMLAAMTVASVIAAVLTVVGHINIGLEPPADAPRGKEWSEHLVRTTASFSTESVAVRWLTGGLTHHLAHHLRPVAPRFELPALHDTTVTAIAERAGLPVVVYPTLRSAVVNHYRRLRELGQPGAIETPAEREQRLLAAAARTPAASGRGPAA
ncbi:fatty acid desaturase family protein [Motilibacter peucedani]|uniref:fatty acid desaturase family protein n=1 Tax=Motilibacter peucedani TaxID=598650 RepID=UPI001602596B|nr:fatty acid desaturase [Motilibacter peucedani]